MPDCTKYVVVDAANGKGPVTVPCTETRSGHRLHTINYQWSEPDEPVKHTNVFEGVTTTKDISTGGFRDPRERHRVDL